VLTEIAATIGELLQDPIVLIVVAVALLALAVIGVVVSRRARRRSQQRRRLQKAFGPEYDRTTGDLGRRKGERDLADRLERHGHIERRLLDAEAVGAIHGRFDELQAQFVDAPADAVSRADELVRSVAVSLGYPQADSRERLLADVSVDHPQEVAAHRRAIDGTEARRSSEPSTEELRGGMLAARALVDAMLAPSLRRLAEVGQAPQRRELRDRGALAELLGEDADTTPRATAHEDADHTRTPDAQQPSQREDQRPVEHEDQLSVEHEDQLSVEHDEQLSTRHEDDAIIELPEHEGSQRSRPDA
jgi:hypothetical protein